MATQLNGAEILNEDKVSEFIKEAKKELTLVAFPVPSDIQNTIINISDPDILKCLIPNELSQYMVELSVYGMGLKAQENRLKSYINWCESNIRFVVGQKLNDVNAFSFHEKDALIRSNDETARHFEVKKISAQLKLDLIKDISEKIDVVVNTLRNFYFEKRNKENGKT